MRDRLLTVHEASLELGCSVSTIKRRISDGLIPTFSDGRLVRIRAVDLERYVLERVVRRTQDAAAVTVAGRELPNGSRLWD